MESIFLLIVGLFHYISAEAYNLIDTEFLNTENSQNRDTGSTASTAILVGDRLLVANVGDSRVVICRAGKGKPFFVTIANLLTFDSRADAAIIKCVLLPFIFVMEK